MTYDQWFRSQQGIPYDGSYLFAEAAWDHQQKKIDELHVELARYIEVATAYQRFFFECSDRLEKIADLCEMKAKEKA